MADRRNVRNRDISPASLSVEQIQARIQQLDVKIERSNLELTDVLSYTSTPENTDSEDEDCQLSPMSHSATTLYKQMMQANLDPDIDEDISNLYEDNRYRHKMHKKMIKMRNTVRKEDIETAMQDVSFHQRLEDVKTLFPSNGGRPGLRQLVSFYTYSTEKKPKEEKEQEENEEDNLSD
jgi:hypothetical protein